MGSARVLNCLRCPALLYGPPAVAAESIPLNYNALQEKAGDRFRIHETDVEMTWPLHFSLVNLAVDDEFDSITEGYRNCDANLAVLGPHDGFHFTSPLLRPRRSSFGTCRW